MSVIHEDMLQIRENLTEADLSFYDNATILISGCAGSIGYELITFLLSCPGISTIIGIDNCCLGHPAWIDSLSADPHFLFLEEDISAIDLWSDPRFEAVTHVFHMASIASPTSYRDAPIMTLDSNINGCRNLLDRYKHKKLKTFCAFSSSEIYGSPDDAHIPTGEDYLGNVSCTGPRACYDEAKRYMETLCSVFSQQYAMPCVILRPFNIFGPGMKLNDLRVPADCARAVLEGRPISIYSDGSPTRTFCYMTDAITWILKAASVGRFEIFNIGTAEPELTIAAFARMFCDVGSRVCNYRHSFQYEISSDAAYLVDNPLRRCPDLRHACEALDFYPRISTEEGIERYLTFLLEQQTEGVGWIW